MYEPTTVVDTFWVLQLASGEFLRPGGSTSDPLSCYRYMDAEAARQWGAHLTGARPVQLQKTTMTTVTRLPDDYCAGCRMGPSCPDHG